VAAAIEAADAGRLDERSALLAHHYEGAGEDLKAAEAHRRAAGWVGATDLKAAVWHWRRVRELVRGRTGEDASRLGLLACQHLLNLSWRFEVSADEILGAVGGRRGLRPGAGGPDRRDQDLDAAQPGLLLGGGPVAVRQPGER
jgi:hypothetical protein